MYVPCALFSNLKLYPFTPFCKQAASKQEVACKGNVIINGIN